MFSHGSPFEQVSAYRDHVEEQSNLESRPSVVVKRVGKGGGRSLRLNAHVDTVENGDPDTWTYGPLSGDVVGDVLYGRGSCDMKGGLVTHIGALDALDALGVELGGDVTVAATVGWAPWLPFWPAIAPKRPLLRSRRAWHSSRRREGRSSSG